MASLLIMLPTPQVLCRMTVLPVGDSDMNGLQPRGGQRGHEELAGFVISLRLSASLGHLKPIVALLVGGLSP